MMADGTQPMYLTGTSVIEIAHASSDPIGNFEVVARITSYNVCYTKLLRFRFGCQDIDRLVLETLARIGAEAGCQFVTSTSKRCFGIRDWQSVNTRRSVAAVFHSRTCMEWRDFRDSEPARYLAMTLPMADIEPDGYQQNGADAFALCAALVDELGVITSYSIHYTKLYDGYARSTGKVGVCIATSGPGATNLITGLADALLDSVPVVAITGQVASPLIGTDAFQEVDVLGLSLACTKHSFMVQSVDELGQVVADAFNIARSGRPGPVLVDIPKDIQLAPADIETLIELVAENHQDDESEAMAVAQASYNFV